MVIKLALTLSVILQFATAIVALSLIKRTRANIAWWLISLGFLLMAFRRLFELYQVYDTENFFINDLTNSWIGVFISFVMLLSLSFIRRIFNIQKRLDELKKANEAKVFSAIVKTEENQKQQFSKELHDGLGPLLASVKMSLSAMNQGDSATFNATILKNAEHQIDESIRTVKEISNSLSPHVLNNFGLQKAIKSFITNLQLIDNPNISFNHNIQNERFPYNIETVAYRVVCELFFNSLKHAEAQNIYLDIFYDEPILNIKYMDDGKGFRHDEEPRENYGMGLTNIQSRVKSVNGNIQIYSAPDQGFNMSIVIKTK
ncbi:MAG: two-component sensor histidine kinase [Salinivirgaceae bacterium]|nr:MAG: two-component sensor histidine kinase [Salinivirgaceae bacterium]